ISCRGNRLSFLVRGGIAVVCLFFFTATGAFGQHVEFGIKTGVPRTDVLETTTAFGFEAHTKGYTMGPVMDIRIPGQFSVEIGAMYKRFDQQGQATTILGYTCLDCEEGPVAIRQFQNVSKAGRSWEFPVTLQYHVPYRSLRPYVEGGFSFNNLSGVL